MRNLCDNRSLRLIAIAFLLIPAMPLVGYSRNSRQEKSAAQEHSEPNNARFITSDIERFWNAYDKAMAAPHEERVDILQREYIDPGTAGVKGIAGSGRLNAKALAQRIE